MKKITNINITNKIHQMKERISDFEDTIEEINMSVKEKYYIKKFCNKKIQNICNPIKRSNLKIVVLEYGKESSSKAQKILSTGL